MRSAAADIIGIIICQGDCSASAWLDTSRGREPETGLFDGLRVWGRHTRRGETEGGVFGVVVKVHAGVPDPCYL